MLDNQEIIYALIKQNYELINKNNVLLERISQNQKMSYIMILFVFLVFFVILK